MRRSRRKCRAFVGFLVLAFVEKRVFVQGLSSVGTTSSRRERVGRKEFFTLQSHVYDDSVALSLLSDHDDTIHDDEDDDIMSDSFLASPLSQAVFSEEEEKDSWYPGSFSRNENWLEEASEALLDLEKVPLGSLTEEDVLSIAGLMAAWVRRRSLEAALSVEKLLKRVVDDMRAGNSDIHVTARMYTIVGQSNSFSCQCCDTYFSLSQAYLKILGNRRVG